MADELLKYVENQLRSGYTQTQIRQALINRGYDPNIVQGAIDSVSMRSLNSDSVQMNSSYISKSLSKQIIFVALGLSAIILLVFLSIFFFKKEALLDVMTSPEKQIYHPGDFVSFNIQIFNMGAKDKFDVTLNYRVLDKNDNLITGTEETIAISTSASHRKEVRLPNSMKSGDYILKVFANYEGKIATSAFTFKIEPKQINIQPIAKTINSSLIETQGNSQNNQKPNNQLIASCEDGIRNQDESGIDCGGICGGYWYEFTCNQEPQKITTTPVIKSVGAIILEARNLAKTNAYEAMQICYDFSSEISKDACIKSVAQSSMQSIHCEQVINDNERDLCYYPFFMNGDYTVCEKLVTKESLETCAQLKKITEITLKSDDVNSQ